MRDTDVPSCQSLTTCLRLILRGPHFYGLSCHSSQRLRDQCSNFSSHVFSLMCRGEGAGCPVWLGLAHGSQALSVLGRDCPQQPGRGRRGGWEPSSRLRKAGFLLLWQTQFPASLPDAASLSAGARVAGPAAGCRFRGERPWCQRQGSCRGEAFPSQAAGRPTVRCPNHRVTWHTGPGILATGRGFEFSVDGGVDCGMGCLV